MKPPLLYWVSRSNLILPCVVGSECRFNDSFLVSLGQVSHVDSNQVFTDSSFALDCLVDRARSIFWAEVRSLEVE